MKAFVVDEDQIKKLGLVFLGMVIAAFLSGYYLGGKQLFSDDAADQTAQIKKVENKLENAEVAPVTGTNKLKNEKQKVAPLKSDKANKKTHTKVEKKVEKKTQKKAEKKKVVVKKVIKKASVKKDEAKKTSNVVKANIAKNKNEDISENKKQNITKDKVAKDKAIKKEIVKSSKPQNLTGALSDKNAMQSKRVYSIQAGMFASEANANSFIEKLAEKQFDAYLSDFVSSSGAIKYNVRVGRFEKRDQARVLLNEFQKVFSSPAYVVIAQ